MSYLVEVTVPGRIGRRRAIRPSLIEAVRLASLVLRLGGVVSLRPLALEKSAARG